MRIFQCSLPDTSQRYFKGISHSIHRVSQVTNFQFYHIGSRGGITQVKVIFLNQSARTLVRNVKGPVRKGDVLALLESEREARRLR